MPWNERQNEAFPPQPLRGAHVCHATPKEAFVMNNIIYIVGLVVVVIAVLSFFGLR